MKRLFLNAFGAIPIGPRWIVILFALSFPLAILGHANPAFDFYRFLSLDSEKVWAGQIWRVFTYGFLSASPIDWIVNLFWLVTLTSILGRNWSGFEFWIYCLLAVFAGAIPISFLMGNVGGFVGVWAMIFALLVAWDWFYKNEQLVMLGLGEMSVRQAAMLIAIIDSVVLYFSCGGWRLMVAMWCGGLAGWLYLTLRSRLFLRKTAHEIRSERVARLEL